MQSLNQRRAGKVVSNNIRYADVKSSNPLGTGTVSRWMKNPPVSVDMPSTSDLGIQAGVYGAMMVLTYVNGSSLESSGMPYAGADVPGLILASSFGASLYFMTRKNVKLGNDNFHLLLSSPQASISDVVMCWYRESSCVNGRRISGRCSGGIGRWDLAARWCGPVSGSPLPSCSCEWIHSLLSVLGVSMLTVELCTLASANLAQPVTLVYLSVICILYRTLKVNNS